MYDSATFINDKPQVFTDAPALAVVLGCGHKFRNKPESGVGARVQRRRLFAALEAIRHGRLPAGTALMCTGTETEELRFKSDIADYQALHPAFVMPPAVFDRATTVTRDHGDNVVRDIEDNGGCRTMPVHLFTDLWHMPRALIGKRQAGLTTITPHTVLLGHGEPHAWRDGLCILRGEVWGVADGRWGVSGGGVLKNKRAGAYGWAEYFGAAVTSLAAPFNTIRRQKVQHRHAKVMQPAA